MTRKEVEDLIANKQNIYVLSKNALGKKTIEAFDTNLYEFRNFNDFGFEIIDRTQCSKQILWINYSQIKTRQEAEWFEEFGNITREEILNLPTYEEMIKEPRCLDCWTKEFVVMDNDKLIWIAFIGVDFDCEIVSVEMGADKYFVEQLKKDNYIKACTIARKLFLGESIEEGENNEDSKN